MENISDIENRTHLFREAVKRYSGRTGLVPDVKAALIDMDGVLYDSMPYHTLAWKQMTDEAGLSVPRDEFYLFEGMTGAATLRLIFRREKGIDLSDEEIKRLYARKTDLFRAMGRKDMMPGAKDLLEEMSAAGLTRVLVTGSGQQSLITSLDSDFPGAFSSDLMVTAADVSKGKPDPEPYLMGLSRAGLSPEEALVVENAPLGVQAGAGAGCFTIGLTTGPIPAERLYDAGADLVFPSMECFARLFPLLLPYLKNQPV